MEKVVFRHGGGAAMINCGLLRLTSIGEGITGELTAHAESGETSPVWGWDCLTGHNDGRG